MNTQTVGDLIRGRPLRSITSNSTVAAACHLMREHRIGALVVLQNGRLVGILSERDVTVRVIAGHRDPMLTLVREVMTREPATVSTETSLVAARASMRQGRFRHLPVTDGEAVIGMLSMRDLPAAGDEKRGRECVAIVVPALG